MTDTLNNKKAIISRTETTFSTIKKKNAHFHCHCHVELRGL